MHACGLQLSLSESLIAHAEENSVAKEVVKHAWDSGALPRGFKWLAAGATPTNFYPVRPDYQESKDSSFNICTVVTGQNAQSVLVEGTRRAQQT